MERDRSEVRVVHAAAAKPSGSVADASVHMRVVCAAPPAAIAGGAPVPTHLPPAPRSDAETKVITDNTTRCLGDFQAKSWHALFVSALGAVRKRIGDLEGSVPSGDAIEALRASAAALAKACAQESALRGASVSYAPQEGGVTNKDLLRDLADTEALVGGDGGGGGGGGTVSMNSEARGVLLALSNLFASRATAHIQCHNQTLDVVERSLHASSDAMRGLVRTVTAQMDEVRQSEGALRADIGRRFGPGPFAGATVAAATATAATAVGGDGGGGDNSVQRRLAAVSSVIEQVARQQVDALQQKIGIIHDAGNATTQEELVRFNDAVVRADSAFETATAKLAVIHKERESLEKESALDRRARELGGGGDGDGDGSSAATAPHVPRFATPPAAAAGAAATRDALLQRLDEEVHEARAYFISLAANAAQQERQMRETHVAATARALEEERIAALRRTDELVRTLEIKASAAGLDGQVRVLRNAAACRVTHNLAHVLLNHTRSVERAIARLAA